MIQTVLEFVGFLFRLSPVLVSLIIYTILAILLTKNIKKHEKTYYWVFGILSAGYALPMLLRICGLDIPSEWSITYLPLMNRIVGGELVQAKYFIHPMIFIIMFMGALSLKTPHVAGLMSIRKHLSIIVGFPVLAHGIKRVFYTFPGAWDFFVNNSDYMEERGSRIYSLLGTTISNIALFAGIFLIIIFIVLWVTSFNYFQRTLKRKTWKKIQWFAYPLYALLFVQSFGLHLSSLINHNAYMKTEKAQIALVAKQEAKDAEIAKKKTRYEANGWTYRPEPFSFAKYEIPETMYRGFNMTVLIVLYGSYVVLRVRKAKRDKLKKLDVSKS